MYKVNIPTHSLIEANEQIEGETIETKMERILNNQEPIEDGAPILYTERQDGVKPEYNIRTDRFELAVDAMDKSTKQQLAKRKEILEKKAEANKPTEITPNIESGNPSL